MLVGTFTLPGNIGVIPQAFVPTMNVSQVDPSLIIIGPTSKCR